MWMRMRFRVGLVGARLVFDTWGYEGYEEGDCMGILVGKWV